MGYTLSVESITTSRKHVVDFYTNSRALDILESLKKVPPKATLTHVLQDADNEERSLLVFSEQVEQLNHELDNLRRRGIAFDMMAQEGTYLEFDNTDGMWHVRKCGWITGENKAASFGFGNTPEEAVENARALEIENKRKAEELRNNTRKGKWEAEEREKEIEKEAKK